MASVLSAIECANIEDLDLHGTGWFIGFSDCCKSGPGDLRHVRKHQPVHGLSVKWYVHSAGDPAGQKKPVSVGRSVSILVSEASEFRLAFSLSSNFPPQETVEHVLRRRGDYAMWGPGVHHRAFGIQPACMLTLRWSDSPCDGTSP